MSDSRTHYRRLGYVACLLIVVLALVLWQVVNRSIEPAEHMPDDAPASGPSRATADAPPGDDAGATAQLSPDALWRPVEEGTVDPQSIPEYKEVVAGRVLVQLADTQRRLAVGDRVSVSIPQLGETYRPVVERIETGPGTTRSFVGSTAADGQRHRLVFTQGPRSTFAHIGTPQGTYELVANGELGWLMPTANMDQHVDYDKPDYYIVRPGGPDRPQDARR